ncbi:MAG TPA: VWA domain-containing protein [Bryobacteraceae bacterium]|nr:VWA domain-containing protein [Bryobacteraceae bacterium]
MARVGLRTARIAVFASLTSLCTVSFGFQEDGPLISSVPRVRNVRTADLASRLPADLRVDVPLVLIPAHVTNSRGASVTNLTRENFRLFEDNIEQKITYFSKEDAPISIGLLVDASGSMSHKIRKSAEAATAFFRTANPGDEFFLIEFNDHPRLVVPFTSDSNLIYNKIVRARPFGRTSLLDALRVSLTQMKKARNLRKAIVILSDGGDNCSRYTEREVKRIMVEADVQVYAMGIFGSDSFRNRTPEEINGPHLLTELAEESGGKHFPVERLDDLPGICTRIGNELRNQYLLGYIPVNSERDAKYRHVKVLLVAPAGAPQLAVYHRQGYYAPAQ